MFKRVAVILCAGLFGCVATIPPAQLAKPSRLIPILSANESKTIYVSDINVKLIDKKIGQMKVGTLCVGGTDLVWQDNPGVISAMREQMSNSLSKIGYTVYSGLIRSNGERDADVLIGAAVEDVKANICYSVDGMKGAASLTVKWEVFDNKSKKSLFFTGVGASEILKFSKTGDPDVFVMAIEMASENILAQRGFLLATQK